MGCDLLRPALRVGVATGEDDVRVHVVAVAEHPSAEGLPDIDRTVHSTTSAGWTMRPATALAATTAGDAR